MLDLVLLLDVVFWLSAFGILIVGSCVLNLVGGTQVGPGRPWVDGTRSCAQVVPISGHLNAVWPDLLGAVLRSGRPLESVRAVSG